MPLDDAVDLVVSSFESYIQSQREKAAAPAAAAASAASTAATRAAPPPFVPPSSDISYLLNLLADNRQLTIEEIEKVVDYLQERKNKMLIADGRQPAPVANSKWVSFFGIDRTFSKKDHFFGQKISKILCLVFDFICIYFMSSDY